MANEGGRPAAVAAPAANEGQAEEGNGERLNASSSAFASAGGNGMGMHTFRSRVGGSRINVAVPGAAGANAALINGPCSLASSTISSRKAAIALASELPQVHVQHHKVAALPGAGFAAQQHQALTGCHRAPAGK